MAENDDEAVRWMAGAIAWERRLAELRTERAGRDVDVRVAERPEPRVEPRPEPVPEPIGLREPERVPFGAPLVRVPRHDHRVA